MTTREGTARAACTECGRLAEFCSCCDRDDCPVCICYSCLAVALGVSTEQPHEHGG